MTQDKKPIEHALRSAANELIGLARQLGVGAINVYVDPDVEFTYYSATAWKNADDDESLASVNSITEEE